MRRVDILIVEALAIAIFIIGIYFILWGIDLLMPSKYSVLAGVASIGVGILIFGGGLSLLRTLLLTLTTEKKED